MSYVFLMTRGILLGGRLAPRLAKLRLSRWTIRARIIALMLALAVPLNLVIFTVVWHLADNSSETQRTSLLYSARSVAAAVDAKLAEYIDLAKLLARSPALLDERLDAFEAEARRAFVSIEDGWVVVADLDGQQLFNTARPSGERLPIRNPVGFAAQRQAFEGRSPLVSDVQFGTVSRNWIVNIEVPVFKDGQPFRALSVSLAAQSFFNLLNDQHIPRNWLASIIDRQGRVIARVPFHEGLAGQPTSESWRKVMFENGVFNLVSLDGDPIVSAQARAESSGWLVGIAVKEAEMHAAVWTTVRWAAIFGGGLSVLSLLLANALSRRITEPVEELRQNAPALLAGLETEMPAGPPEIGDLWYALKQSAAERQQAERQVAERDARFRATFENAAVGIAHVAPDGSWLSVNRRICDILGYTSEEILTKRFQDLTHPDHLEADLVQLRSLLDGEIDSYCTEKRYFRKDGSVVWARLTVGVVRNEERTASYFVSVVEDISEKKLTEEALLQSELRFRDIFEHAATGIAITDMQGRFQSCNPAYSAMLGYSADELRGMNFSDLVYPEDRDANLAQVQRLVAGMIPSFEIVNRYVGKDGKLIWVRKYGSVLRDAQGHPIYKIALVTDITEHKRHEDRIRESEERLQLALEAAQLGTWRWHVLERADALECDARCRALLDLPPGAPVTNEILTNAIFPEDRAQAKAAAVRALDPEDPCDDYTCEYRVRHADGTVLWLSSRGRAFFEPDPASRSGRRAIFMAGAIRDVTEARLVKAARESEERLRHLGDSLPESAVYRYGRDPDGTPRFHYISAGIEQLNGVRVEEVLQDAGVLLGQVLPEYRTLLAEAERCSAAGMSDFNVEVPMRRPDGEVRWMRLKSRPHGGKDGAVLWDGVQTDITGQKRAQEALRESEAKLRLALDAAKLGIWRWNAGSGTDEMHWDSRCRALFGVPPDVRVTYETWTASVLPEDRVRVEANVTCALDPADPYDETSCQYRVKHPDGPVRWLSSIGRAFFEPDPGSPSGRRALFIAGAVRDVTDMRSAEAALRESEERMRLSNEAAGIGTFTVDPECGCVHYSPELAAMLGFPGITTTKIEDAFARVHRDDLSRVRPQFDAALSGAALGQIKAEFRFVRPGGEIRWMMWAGRVKFCEGSSGRKPFRIVGACVDITERKRQEDQIRLLMREVNHRSKNLLTVVQAIARQTAAANSVDFLARFEERIDALAASQDLLVKNDWKGAKLDELVWSQLAHFKDLIGTRIEFRGPPLFVSASAAQSIGMALHELATNAGKYGALANSDGRVEIEWGLERTNGGAESFVMSWCEKAVQPVAAPSKRGFGSTVICDMTELSLGAKVELAFPATGLFWQFECPANELLDRSSCSVTDESQKRAGSSAFAATRSRVLVVEDEAVVALEISQMLTKEGFEVVGPARTVAQALQLINAVGCDAAVLDINLGTETSEPIALKLKGCGRPFVTVSGYSRAQHPPVFHDAPQLAKPLRPELLTAELRRCTAKTAQRTE